MPLPLAPMAPPLPLRLTDALLGVAALALAGASGCSVLKQLAGSDTVDLEGAQISEMKLDLRRAQKTICPTLSLACPPTCAS